MGSVSGTDLATGYGTQAHAALRGTRAACWLRPCVLLAAFLAFVFCEALLAMLHILLRAGWSLRLMARGSSSRLPLDLDARH